MRVGGCDASWLLLKAKRLYCCFDHSLFSSCYAFMGFPLKLDYFVWVRTRGVLAFCFGLRIVMG